MHAGTGKGGVTKLLRVALNSLVQAGLALGILLFELRPLPAIAKITNCVTSGDLF